MKTFKTVDFLGWAVAAAFASVALALGGRGARQCDGETQAAKPRIASSLAHAERVCGRLGGTVAAPDPNGLASRQASVFPAAFSSDAKGWRLPEPDSLEAVYLSLEDLTEDDQAFFDRIFAASHDGGSASDAAPLVREAAKCGNPGVRFMAVLMLKSKVSASQLDKDGRLAVLDSLVPFWKDANYTVCRVAMPLAADVISESGYGREFVDIARESLEHAFSRWPKNASFCSTDVYSVNAMLNLGWFSRKERSEELMALRKEISNDTTGRFNGLVQAIVEDGGLRFSRKTLKKKGLSILEVPIIEDDTAVGSE